jgi:hypothetical protein
MDMSIFGAVSNHNEQEDNNHEEEAEAGSPTLWGIENDDMELPSDDEEGGGSEDGGKPSKHQVKEKAATVNNEVTKLG